MQHYWSLEDVNLENTWLTIGTFDGVHRGHQEIIRYLTAGAHARGDPAVVLTFNPHPAVVLGKRTDCQCLTAPQEKADLLGQLGVDVVITHPFSLELAAMGAREFIQMVNARLRLRQLWEGDDFALGHSREGNIEKLRQLGQELGFEVHAVTKIEIDGEMVSSSQIRAFLANGEVELAERSLGRPYRLAGEVVPGDGRGRTIGIPTANLAILADVIMPKKGVYACQARVNGQTRGAVTNIGVRPTFEDQPVPPRIETHILELDEDLYGQHIQLEFLARLRDEQRFGDVQALIDQIHADIRQAQDVFNHRKNNPLNNRKIP